MWLMLITAPTLAPFATNGNLLDGSWQACNGYFLQHHLRAGVDCVFPTWLLGFFYTNIYDRALYWPFYVWQILLAGCLSVNVAGFALRFPRPADRLLALCACGATLTLLRSDLPYYVLMLLAGSLLLSSSVGRTARFVGTLFLLVLISLLKFSFMALAVVIVALVALHSGLSLLKSRTASAQTKQDTEQTRPAKTTQTYVTVLLAPLVFATIFLVLWLLMGQHITDLPTALRNEAAVSGGYNEAMGLSSSNLTLLVGAAALALFGLLATTTRKPQNISGFSGKCLLLITAVLLWKYGFVRGDGGHSGIFFGTLLIMLLLLPVYFGSHTAQAVWHRRLGWTCALICLAGMVTPYRLLEIKSLVRDWARQPLNSAGFVVAPWRRQRELETELAHLRNQWQLPAVRAAVGDAAVDVVSYEQEVAFLNDLNLHPRPIYQGYCAYTPFLCALNANFYRSAQAPAFVLYKLQAIDKRLPTLDDSLTLLELLRSYHPLLVEKGFTLLARNTHSPAAPLHALPVRRMTDVRFGQDITLADNAPYHLLTVHVRPALRGKLKSVLLRASALTIDVQTEDGRTAHYLLPPAMAESTTLLDPLLQNSRDVVRLYGGLPSKRARSFRLQCGSPSLFQQPLEVTLTPLNALVGEHLTTAQANVLLTPALWPATAQASAGF